MRRIAIIMIALLVVCFQAEAKKKPSRSRGKSKGSHTERSGYYSFSAGPSIPMGDFSKEPSGTDPKGTAKMGLFINLADFGFAFAGHFGVAGKLCAGMNHIDSEKFAGYKDSKSLWAYGGLMVGPLATFNVAGDLYADIHPVFGLVTAVSPEVKDPGTNTVFLHANQAMAFGFDFGTSFRYKLGENISAALNLDYFSTKPEFTFEIDNNVKSKAKVQISTLAATVGLAFSL